PRVRRIALQGFVGRAPLGRRGKRAPALAEEPREARQRLGPAHSAEGVERRQPHRAAPPRRSHDPSTPRRGWTIAGPPRWAASSTAAVAARASGSAIALSRYSRPTAGSSSSRLRRASSRTRRSAWPYRRRIVGSEERSPTARKSAIMFRRTYQLESVSQRVASGTTSAPRVARKPKTRRPRIPTI